MTSRVEKLLHAANPFRILSRLGWYLRHPRGTFNRALVAAGEYLGPLTPGAISYRLIDRLYLRDDNLAEVQSVVRTATRQGAELLSSQPPPANAPEALVFILRSSWFWSHAVHSHLVACALRQLGYRVNLVVCSGAVEHCGIAQDIHASVRPPFTCGACRAVTASLNQSGFRVLDLGDYRTVDEDERVRAFSDLSAQGQRDYQLDGVPLLETVRPFLMRFFHGDFRKIEPTQPEVLDHCRAGIRFALRHRRLLEEVRPACVCYFNGLFFPEYLFFRQARARGIDALCVERGLNQNSIFLSVNDPASHYRSEALWEQVQGRITDEAVGLAEDYLDRRVTQPVDPCGAQRDILDADEEKYRCLAAEPYVVFFAPVTHDTSAMEKGDPAGGFFASLGRLCTTAIELRRRLVVRSHPDEHLPANPSHYPVARYLADRGFTASPYVVCLDSTERWNPYSLARYADASVVYNGNLGMELPALGHRVFNIADSHYAGKGFTDDLLGLEDFRRVFEAPPGPLDPDRRQRALEYLYYYIFVASIPVDRFLDEDRPFHYRLPEAADPDGCRNQLRRLTERVASLLAVAECTPDAEGPRLAGRVPACGPVA